MTKGHSIDWLPEELAWIEANCHLPRKIRHQMFCARFQRGEINQAALDALCKRNRWLTGRDGRWHAGAAPSNKGRKMVVHPNSRATQFRPGERNGVAQRLYVPIGTEKVRDGYLVRKVNDDLPLQARWRFVHLIRWEELHGPLPAGHCLKCLDGDRMNTDPSNWAPIPRALLPRLNGRHTVAYDPAPAELKPALLATAKLEHAARELRRAKRQQAAG